MLTILKKCYSYTISKNYKTQSKTSGYHVHNLLGPKSSQEAHIGCTATLNCLFVNFLSSLLVCVMLVVVVVRGRGGQ